MPFAADCRQRHKHTDGHMESPITECLLQLIAGKGTKTLNVLYSSGYIAIVEDPVGGILRVHRSNFLSIIFLASQTWNAKQMHLKH